MRSVFEDSDMVFESISDNIVHVRMPDKRMLALAMCRIQEHYESPFPEIRGKVFTLGQLRAMGSRHCPGVFTYAGGNRFDADWSGFNWPSYALEPFIRGMFDPLTEYEEDLVNALKCKQGDYYVIGTYGDKDPDGALDHEICHALYYTDKAYHGAVKAALSQYRERLSGLRDMLTSWGYCEEVLDDECHAYLSADYDWLTSRKEDIEKFKVYLPKSLHLRLRKIKDKHFKEKK